LHLKKKQQQRPYDKWVRFRESIRESNFKREALIKEFAEFLRKVLPKAKSQEHVIPKLDVVSEQTLIKRTSSPPPLDVPDTKDDAVFGETASPFLFSPYTRFLDTQYDIRKDGDNLKIGNSNVSVDNSSNITIRGKQFEGTADLTRKTVDYNSIDKNDLHKYKTILEMTNAHLEGYNAGGNIQTSRRIKFRNVITKLYPEAKRVSRQQWVTY
jgi:hypothetical protein